MSSVKNVIENMVLSLYMYNKNYGRVRFSIDELHDIFNKVIMNRKTIANYIATLEQFGYLIKEQTQEYLRYNITDKTLELGKILYEQKNPLPTPKEEEKGGQKEEETHKKTTLDDIFPKY